MAGEITTPLLPCAAIDEIIVFYEALGFNTTYRQQRPQGYAIVIRDDLALHFFSIDGFNPADSYGSCLVGVPDTGALYEAFREGLRARYGNVPLAGIPRLTRPRKKQDGVTGFALIDLGGNWLRFYTLARDTGTDAKSSPRDPARSALATAVHAAGLLGDSKGDHAGAARLLDKALAREKSPTSVDRVAALVYRAELAFNLGDYAGAARFVGQVETIALDAESSAVIRGDLERADDLRQALVIHARA